MCIAFLRHAMAMDEMALLNVQVVSLRDDLSKLVSDINAASWDAANDIAPYTEDALRFYLARDSSIFIACYGADKSDSTLMGIGSGCFAYKPYGNERWLYVDEVDVCVDQRQKGAGKRIMQAFIEIAATSNCEELWLGTEVDNAAANALYRSLSPDEVSNVVGYAYDTSRR
ncbi:MAG: GNAT family N-acetyltransferase [Pseudomonadota bacterium]